MFAHFIKSYISFVVETEEIVANRNLELLSEQMQGIQKIYKISN